MPHYGINPWGAVKRFFAKFATFEGRASRSEYAWVMVTITVLHPVALSLIYFPMVEMELNGQEATGALAAVLPAAIGWMAFLLVTLVPSLAVSVRRLHDAGWSGWLFLLSFALFWVQYGELFFNAVLAFLPSSEKSHRYDPRSGYNSFSRSSSGQGGSAKLTDA